MKRDEIWWVNFEPAVGGEIRQKRPAIIVSNDAANKHLKVFADVTSRLGSEAALACVSQQERASRAVSHTKAS